MLNWILSLLYIIFSDKLKQTNLMKKYCKNRDSVNMTTISEILKILRSTNCKLTNNLTLKKFSLTLCFKGT